MVYRHDIHPCPERRMDVSGLCHGLMQSQKCLWDEHGGGAGGAGSKQRLSECKGHRRNYPSQQFGEPVYQSGV